MQVTIQENLSDDRVSFFELLDEKGIKLAQVFDSVNVELIADRINALHGVFKPKETLSMVRTTLKSLLHVVDAEDQQRIKDLLLRLNGETVT